MEYRVGCLADLISGVKSSLPKSSKIVLQPVASVDDVTRKKKKRKSASVEFVPVIGPAESAVVTKSSKIVPKPVSSVNDVTRKKKRKPASTDFVPVIGPAESAVVTSWASKADNKTQSTKKKNRYPDAYPTEPSEFAGNSNNATASFIDKPKQPLDQAAEARTVFVKNLPINIKENKTKKIFERFGEVECVRYRCAPRADPRVPKKVAFIKKKFHPDRTTICAFVRFKSKDDAEKALSEANGMEFEGHHILVDKALKENVHDQKKAVFVGNVPFGAEEEDMWAVFSKCGEIRDIRIVRDSETGVGKGFAYVNFESNDGVELALSLDGELLKDRNIRVKRAVNRPKNKPTSDKQQSISQQRRKPFSEQKEKKFKGNKTREIAFSNKLGPKASKFDDNLNKKKWKKKGNGAFGNKKRDTGKLSYQGMTGEQKKGKRTKVNKEEKKKKIIAKKLGFA